MANDGDMKQPEHESLRESYSASDTMKRDLQTIHAFNPYSTEAKRRRARVIAEINSGWSKAAEHALSRIAQHFTSKG